MVLSEELRAKAAMNSTPAPNPGSIVRVRERYWVLLPDDDPQVYRLRPLTGATDETVKLHKALSDRLAYSLPSERIDPAQFPPPAPEDLSDAGSAQLLWQAARLSLREGATPLRSLGHISIRPRTYQFVPLLMALRQRPVRLLIADDVGVGKTIEALLIARELLELGEIRRMAVLCPPYLCDQWQQELHEKFNLESVAIRSGTVAQLERGLPAGRTIYEHYPVQVASIDYLKSERNRSLFLMHAPELIIVDEAHGATATTDRAQQQRHDLVQRVAAYPNRHLLLLTATPHSGISGSFQSLLGLLDPGFGQRPIAELAPDQMDELARHFVQRTRRDIEKEWEGARCFPERILEDKTYSLSAAYERLFQKTYDFCAEIVRSGVHLEERKRRVRYWGALALLRCVMSSPAAARVALENRRNRLFGDEDSEEVDFHDYVFESDEDRTEDEQPAGVLEETPEALSDDERRKLRELSALAEQLASSGQDTKLQAMRDLVLDLLSEGFRPIIWCRYVATAEYVAAELNHALADLFPGLQVACITGRQGDDERRARIEEIDAERPHVLVATDCLSEGINLQQKFDAAVHYDLPWNPNRLEQREGRVDRFGQTAPQVKTIRYFSPDNPVDGVVIRVLLDKAREIRKTLGTYVPVPKESESVAEAVLNALFLHQGRYAPKRQLAFDFAQPEVQNLQDQWQRAANQERNNRTRFAQRALKPAEVQRELEATDAVLGDPAAVRDFLLTAAQRLDLTLRRDKTPDKTPDVYRVAVAPEDTRGVPEAVRFALPASKDGFWRICFDSPAPQGAEYVGRNHRFVAATARFLFEEALTQHGGARASRCGVLATKAVAFPTTLLLLRVRYLLEESGHTPLFAEEVLVLGYHQAPGGASQWLVRDEALSLLAQARPDANLPLEAKRRLVAEALDEYPGLEPASRTQVEARAAELTQAHARVARATGGGRRPRTVTPQFPADLLGVLRLQPLPVGKE